MIEKVGMDNLANFVRAEKMIVETKEKENAKVSKA